MFAPKQVVSDIQLGETTELRDGIGPRPYPRREIVTRVNGLWVPGGHINLPALVNDVISLQ